MLGRTAIKYQPSRGLPRVSALVRSGGVQSAQASAAAAFFRPAARRVEYGWGRPCGSPGMPPCDSGDPVSALQGLAADVDVPKPRTFPMFCDSVRVQLAELKWLLDKATTSTPTVAKAQALYAHLDGMALYVGVIGDACERDSKSLAETIAALRSELVARGAIPASTPSFTTPQQETPNEMNPWVKVGIIGGIAVVGVVGLAYLTGNLATIVRAVKGR